MYDSGEPFNHYACLQRHKKHLKDRHASSWFYGEGRGATWEEFLIYCEQQKRNVMRSSIYEESCPYNPYRYWRTFYLSGPRKFAKQQTARKARQEFRQRVKKCEDWDEFYLNDYEKSFDYDWTIW